MIELIFLFLDHQGAQHEIFMEDTHFTAIACFDIWQSQSCEGKKTKGQRYNKILLTERQSNLSFTDGVLCGRLWIFH